MSRARYFASRFFRSRFFGASEDEGGYFGANYFSSEFFKARFFRQGSEAESVSIEASLDAYEAADTLEAAANVSQVAVRAFGSPRHRRVKLPEPIFADLDVYERPDTCEAVVQLGPDPVVMDNNLLLIAA